MLEELKKQISEWEKELRKHERDPEVLKIFNNMSQYLINQKEYINELGDMLENAQKAYEELRREYHMEGYDLRH